MFNFKSEEKEPDYRYQTVGYDDTNFMMNTGTFFWVGVGWAIGLGLYILLKKVKTRHRLIEKLYLYLKGLLVYKFVIRLAIEGYFDIIMSSFINI
jgi:hypothetical protein